MRTLLPNSRISSFWITSDVPWLLLWIFLLMRSLAPCTEPGWRSVSSQNTRALDAKADVDSDSAARMNRIFFINLRILMFLHRYTYPLGFVEGLFWEPAVAISKQLRYFVTHHTPAAGQSLSNAILFFLTSEITGERHKSCAGSRLENRTSEELNVRRTKHSKN